MVRRFGRSPRAFGANIPHLSAIVAGKPVLPPPVTVDYYSTMPQYPDGFGMMLNNELGDCMCAAFYHARLVWTFHSKGVGQVAADREVELLYEHACGYKASESGEGPGGSAQHVLTYIHKHGAPLHATRVDRILGFVEVDPRNVDDVKRAIYHGGVALLGFNIPQNITPPHGEAPRIWDVAPGHEKLVGGHAVIAVGYDADQLTVVSWGAIYKMTWSFFAKYVDEVYMMADRAWHDSAFAKKHNLALPGGLSDAELAEQMKFV